jgi:hypothetical protein
VYRRSNTDVCLRCDRYLLPEATMPLGEWAPPLATKRARSNFHARGVQKLCQSPWIQFINPIRPKNRFRRLSGVDQPRPTLRGPTDESSAFDVDPADLVFARARQTSIGPVGYANPSGGSRAPGSSVGAVESASSDSGGGRLRRGRVVAVPVVPACARGGGASAAFARVQGARDRGAPPRAGGASPPDLLSAVGRA